MWHLLLWGIDLGGTKIEGLVIEIPLPAERKQSLGKRGEAPKVLARLRIPTGADRGYDHIVMQVATVVNQLEVATGQTRPDVIGIGTPGAVIPATGLMKNCNTTCLNRRPLPSDLSSALGVEVKVANDADCFALAEALLGAGRGHHTVFGVIMGTGVGGGIVVGGDLVAGPNGLTGEWGHTTLVPGGKLCYCGRRGCVETYLSGPAVEQAHFDRSGIHLGLAEIAALAAKEVAADPTVSDCQETIARMCDNFGRALSTVVNVLDPDVIVLGGGAGQIHQLQALGRERLAENVFGPDFATPFLTPELGDSAGVFGAALLTAPALSA